MMRMAIRMLFMLAATKLKIFPITVTTRASKANPAKKIRISPTKPKKTKIAFIAN
jgi:hypothetical protein